MSDLQFDDALIQIRNKLQQDKIKLWLEPYFKDDIGSNELELQNLSKNYSETLNITYEMCLIILKDLQSRALERIDEKKVYQETGIATVKVRVPSISTLHTLNIQLKLDSLGLELKEKIGEEVKMPTLRMKLISEGKVILDGSTLNEQNVKNGALIMVIMLHDNPITMEIVKQREELEAIKEDTSLLASKADSFLIHLEDQSGNQVSLPENEKKALMVAMALHAKGQDALKHGDYACALVMFLDADTEFRQCNSSLLENVDNYAILNLDIVWCYLCLKCITQINEADERLKICEQSFNRSYGANLERVIALKGTPGNEAVLFMRLHLLQAIVLYYQNNRNESWTLLCRAEEELKNLQVDENNFIALIELGFNPAEARLGLRATQNDVNAAAVHINALREQRDRARKQSLEDWVRNKERQKLGKCADNKQWIEPKFVQMLQTMGYRRETARLALQQSNNNVSYAVQIIQDNPHLLEETASTSRTESIGHIILDMLPQLESAGFDPRMAKLALKKHAGDILAAIEELIANGGIIEGENFSDEEIDRISNESEEKKKEKAALKRLNNFISAADDEHLDINLEQDEIYLNQYKTLLKTETK